MRLHPLASILIAVLFFAQQAVDLPPAGATQLTGTIREERVVTPQAMVREQVTGGLYGMVLDVQGKPLPGVTVGVPDRGLYTKTGAEGRFSLPAVTAGPYIISFTKPGYAPRSMGWDDGMAAPLTAYLKKTGKTVVLDDQLRHLGDGSYSPWSANAGQFQKPSEGAAFVRKFRLDGDVSGKTVHLKIGSVIGLDTQQAHLTGQSGFHRVSSPLEVRLNGQMVGRIGLNGDGQQLTLPTRHLSIHGINVLEIRTGFQVPDGQYVDYDDIELMFLTLEF